MYVVVTGGSGFLGSHVAEELIRKGHEVGIFDVNPPHPDILRLANCRHVQGDLRSLDSVIDGLADAEAICHLAGVGDVYLAGKEPYTAAMFNVAGTAHMVEGALKHGVRKLVYASTWEVYGEPHYQPIDEDHPCNPDHPYNITKYAGELIALSADRLRGLPVVALRLGTAFGARMRPNSVFSIFIKKALNREPITIQGTGEQSRQFTHATDIARAFVTAIESDVRGEAINIVSSESTSIRRLAELVTRELSTSIEYSTARAGDIAPARVSSTKAKRLLGWEALVRFEDGLREMIEAEAGVLRR
ncbi:MAG: NAD-dependent epimerase/dehydratase family protein [Chloroflexi bacterium]|nr:NAD-dependent epimerase/dehydratase family protein [Chloroflexota bacterium]